MILIVDDEPSITSALEFYFASEGYETRIAHNGFEAVEKLRQERPSLVVLDVMLPDVSGYEVCKHIRKQDGYTPILMLTAKDTLDDKIRGLDVGADAYLPKPYNPKELLAQARALLRLSEKKKEAVLECGQLKMNLSENTFCIDDIPVTLTTTEYEILEIFLRSPGRVFGRQTILRKIWGYDTGVVSRAVDTHIQRIRAKIESNPSQPVYLLTVRGFGYRLVCPDN